MVAAKKKLAFSPKQAATVAPPSVEPIPVEALDALTAPSKWPRPEVETTGNATRPHVISSQTMGTTTSNVLLPHLIDQVSAEVLQNPSILTMGQEIMVQLTTQATVEVKSIIAPVVEGLALLKLVVAHVDVGPAATILEAVATMAEINPPPNPKKLT